MTKNLVMNFLNAANKKVSVTLNSVKATVTEAEVAATMNLIIANPVFNISGGNFVTKESAQIVETTVTKMVV